jgi:hypothetical protein
MIDTKAAALGHCLCPLQLGPLFCLHYLDIGGNPCANTKRPVARLPSLQRRYPDDAFPKGFYVRRIQGELWLCGYRAGPDHAWAAADHLLFCQAEEAV